MRIMTFNVRGSFHADPHNSWEERRDLNIATIKKYAPDILGMQEVQSGNMQAYEAELPEYDVELGPISIRKTERFHHVPIYWKRAEYEKVDAGGFYLSDTPDEWSAGWGAELIRAVTWVRLRDLQYDLEFYVLNTHFNHEQDNHLSRTKSAELIVKRLAEINTDNCPEFVTADFNARPESDAYKVFADAGYKDTYVEAGLSDDVITFHGFAGDALSYEGQPITALRIDWVLVKPGPQLVRTLTCHVVKDHNHPTYPSDHYPVFSDLVMDE